MEDFLNIDWTYKTLDSYEELITKPFIENIESSLAYQEIISTGNNGVCDNDEPKSLQDLKPRLQFVPGCCYFKKNMTTFSTLSIREHAICLQALELYQSGRVKLIQSEQNELELYKQLSNKIKLENVKFSNFVKENWPVDIKKYKLPSNLRWFAIYNWKRKMKTIKNYYPHSYRDYGTYPFSVEENTDPVEMVHLENLLELGTVAKYTPPLLSMRTIFPISSLPNPMKPKYHSNLPVSMDDNIKKILENNQNIDVVLSSSSLARFINYNDELDSWDMPLIIRNVEGKGTKKKVIFFDKPLAKKTINLSQLNQFSVQVLLKTNFCHHEEFSFPDLANEIVAENEANSDQADGSSSKPVNKPFATNRKLHHNVSYRCWKLHVKIDENDLTKFKRKYPVYNVLIRTKVHGCEKSDVDSGLNPICLFAKLENQLCYGANIPTKAELAKQWVLLASRPFSKLYRVRVHNASREVIAIENCNLQKINNEAVYHHNYKPHLGLNILYKVLLEMQNISEGRYLMRYSPKTGPFLLVLKEAEDGLLSTYNLHEDYDKNSAFNLKPDPHWCPIDVNYILPAHKSLKWLPGMFKPQIPVPQKKAIMKKKKKKKKKAKKGKMITVNKNNNDNNK